MAEYLKYLVGWPGPSGFGSRTTAEEVTADLDLTSHTVLITGHFLLTNLLLDNIIATAKKYGIEGRIVIVSSNAHFLTKALDLKTVNDEKSFQWLISYGKSKLANILHAKELARRLKEKSVNVTANALHPGGIRTNILRDLNATFATVLLFMVSWAFKTVPQGAATTCYLAAHPTVAGVSGKYFCDCNEYECSSYANDMKRAADLWAYSEGITSSYMD